jgi:hypothetical protein
MHHDPLWNPIPHLNIYPSNCVIKLHIKLQLHVQILFLKLVVTIFGLRYYTFLRARVPIFKKVFGQHGPY